MSFSFFVAKRYLKAGRENRFFSWISTLTIVGIAIGVCALIVVLSVINGFESQLRRTFLAANAHILAYRFPQGLRDHEQWQKVIQKDFGDRITGSAPFVHFETMGRKEYLIHAMLIKGMAPKQRQSVQQLGRIVQPPEAMDRLQEEFELVKRGLPLPQVPLIIIGSGLKDSMQVQIGDEIQLIAPKAEEGGPFKEMKTFKVAGIYNSGLQHYDKRLGILSLPAAQELFNMGEVVTGIEIGLKEPKTSREVAAMMADKYHISIKEWQSYNRNIFEAMRNERNVIGLIVALVAFVASFNILTTLFVSVTQKRRDIAVLKSLGASNLQVLKIFIKQSLLIGAIGGASGTCLAFVVAKLLEHVEFVDLPDIYLLAKLPVNYDPWVYLTIGLSSVVIATLAGVYPAYSAARVHPTLGFRLGDKG